MTGFFSISDIKVTSDPTDALNGTFYVPKSTAVTLAPDILRALHANKLIVMGPIMIDIWTALNTDYEPNPGATFVRSLSKEGNAVLTLDGFIYSGDVEIGATLTGVWGTSSIQVTINDTNIVVTISV